MRVVGGELRGRKLKAPEGRAIRPTSDRTRESIFDLLGPGPCGERALDLFAGTGALGIEAVSRGAKIAVFVEQDRAALALIRANLALCGIAAACRLEAREVLRHLALPDRDAPYDLVLLDPPYRQGLAASALALLGAAEWVAPGGVVVAEVERELALPEAIGSLSLFKNRRYGDTAVWLYLRA
jgi:16S rRNA (guanine966-N2)-methyltransferase